MSNETTPALKVPKFKLVQDLVPELPLRVPALPDFISGELNGDRVPDRLELIKSDNHLAFELKLGVYKKVTESSAKSITPTLFKDQSAVASLIYPEKHIIWGTDLPNGTSVQSFEIGDFNQDGDLDIRFMVSQKSEDGKPGVMGAYLLMNQTKPDSVLGFLEPESPRDGDEKEEEDKELEKMQKRRGRDGTPRFLDQKEKLGFFYRGRLFAADSRRPL